MYLCSAGGYFRIKLSRARASIWNHVVKVTLEVTPSLLLQPATAYPVNFDTLTQHRVCLTDVHMLPYHITPRSRLSGSDVTYIYTVRAGITAR